ERGGGEAAPVPTVRPELVPPSNHKGRGEPQKEQVTPVTTMTSSDPKPSASALIRMTDNSSWSELRGTVHAVAGQEVVVRVDDGQFVSVDLSGLRGVAVALKPGSPIVVYGTRGEEKFQALVLLPPDIPPPPQPAAPPPR